MKKSYVKGEMRRVALIPDSAVLGACFGYVEIGPWANAVSCYEPQGGYSCLGLPGSPP